MMDMTSVNKKINAVWPDWRATELVGSGLFGEVYRADCTNAPDCVAAIKVITVPKNEDEVNILRSDRTLWDRAVLDNAAVASALSKELARQELLVNSPNILCAEAYSVRQSDNGCSYDILIRTELLTPITRIDNMGEQETVKLGIDICIALEACAKHGIVHRDIKPSNIFCTDFGTYKLGDIGITRVLETTTGDLTMYTGTPKFMAPEAVMGMEYDARADIYSLGMVLYHILNGMIPPFYPTDGSKLSVEEADSADLRRIRGDEIPAIRSVSRELMEVLHKACEADPSKRYTDASEMKQALVNVYTAILFGRATAHSMGEQAVGGAKWDTTTLFELPTDTDVLTAESTSSVQPQTDTDSSFNAEAYAAALEYSDGFTAEQDKPATKKEKSKLPVVIILSILGFLFVMGTVFAVSSLVGIITRFSTPDTDAVTETDVYVPEGNPVSLSIASMPEKLEYGLGERVSLDGLMLEAVYGDGASVNVDSGFIVTPERLYEVGEHTVSVTYGGRTVELRVTVVETDDETGEIPADAEVISVVMKSMPDKLQYYVGESLDATGMRLDVTYDAGAMATVSDGFTVTPEKFTAVGNQTVVVSYKGKEINFEVEVSPAVFTGISMRTPPKKTIYFTGEALVTDGLSINEIYTDGSVRAVTSGFTVSPTVFTTAGEQYIKVSYKGKTTGFNVTVNGVILTSVSVRTAPAKLSYTVGESIELAGLTLSAVYSNGVTESVPHGYVAISPTVAAVSGKQTVTVSYGGFTTSFDITVADPVSASGTCGKDLVWTLKNGVLTISGTGDMNSYSAGDAPWSKYSDHITAVSVSDGVGSIGSYAFSYLPIISISVPESVKSISDTAVYMCTSLKTISVATNNRYYASKDGVLYSKDMTKLHIYPAGKAESTFTIPNTVKFIGGYQIFRGTVLKEIILTESVYSIDETAFLLAPNIEKVTVRSRSAALASVDGVLFNKSLSELIYFPVNKKVTDYTVPETVKYIRANAFIDNSALTSISLPAGLKSVGKNAFAGCNSLRYVSFAGSRSDWTSVSFDEGNGNLTNTNIEYGS